MLQVSKHREVMYNILRDIFSGPYASHMAFKGGTLCYFIHHLDRFSTDLDFDLIRGVVDEAGFLDAMESLLRQHGKIKEKVKKRHTFFFLLSYGETDMNIKIEINTRIWKSNRYEMVNFFGLEMLAMDRATIFANKLVAVTDRKKVVNRDLYDIFFFFRHLFSVNEAVIQERTGKSLKEYLSELPAYIWKHVTKKSILTGLGEVLDAKQKVFVKERLLDELLGVIRFQIEIR